MHASTSVQTPALRSVGNIVTGDDVQTQIIINCGSLPALLSLLGSSKDGIRNEDVTRLTFPDASFDVVITNDVLEHVPLFQKAYPELFRVLRPGGLLLVTVPFLFDRREHLIRAVLEEGGNVRHLLPPDYHCDPANPAGGVLCYQYFGWNLIDDLRAAGFARAGCLFLWSLYHGIIGGDTAVFYARKA